MMLLFILTTESVAIPTRNRRQFPGIPLQRIDIITNFEEHYYQNKSQQSSAQSVHIFQVAEIKGKGKIVAAPVPPSSLNPEPLPGKTYFSRKLADDVYQVAKNGYVGMFIVTKTGVVAVEAPTLIGEDYFKAIKDVTPLNVTHLILTHSHIDHEGASSMFGDVERISHIETAKTLKDRQDPNRPVPTTTFTDSLTMEIGGKTIQLDYKGPIHVPGNIFVWLPNEKILMSTDAVNPGWAPFKRLQVAEDVAAYLRAPDIILSYPFKILVTGHFGKLGTREDIMNQKEYLRDVQKNSIIATERVNVTELMNRVEDPKNANLLFEVVMRAQIEMCTTLTIQKWVGKMAGVDVFTESACDVINMSQGIDIGQKIIG